MAKSHSPLAQATIDAIEGAAPQAVVDAADQNLQDQITAEEAIREATDLAEAGDREASDLALQGYLDTEINDRAMGDIAEASARAGADTGFAQAPVVLISGDTNFPRGAPLITSTIVGPVLFLSGNFTQDATGVAFLARADKSSVAGVTGEQTSVLVAQFQDNAGDTDHSYNAFVASSSTSTGANTFSAFVVGAGYDNALLSTAGDLVFLDYAPTIIARPAGIGNGPGIEIDAGDAYGEVGDYDGGILRLHGGGGFGGGNDGYTVIGGQGTAPRGLTESPDNLYCEQDVEISGVFSTGGARWIQTTQVTSFPYSVLLTDHYLAVEDNVARALSLPSIATSPPQPFAQVLIIKDWAGTAVGNNITITPNGADTIDGAGSYTINTAYGFVTLISSRDLGGWSRIG